MLQLKRIFRSKYRNRIDDKLSDLYAELAVLINNINNKKYSSSTEHVSLIFYKEDLIKQINLLNTLLK